MRVVSIAQVQLRLVAQSAVTIHRDGREHRNLLLRDKALREAERGLVETIA